MEHSPEELNVSRAIAELAYAIAKADGVLDDQERQAFLQILTQEFELSETTARLRFEAIFQSANNSVEVAYQQAIFLLQRNKKALNADVISRCKAALLKVAEVSGVSQEEKRILERFNKDIQQIYEG